MIGSLRGSVQARLDQRLLIEVQGVGYWVFTGSWQPQGEVFCFVRHVVREDASDLYGFASLEQLEMFDQLRTVPGIGPKAALNILSLGSVNDIRQAIAKKNTAYLSAASGIGPKAAQKIIVEIGGKIKDLESWLDNETTDALQEALLNLGFKPLDIAKAIQDLPPELTETEEQLRWALQKL